MRRIDTAYLVEAARSWTKTAHLWEQTFAGVHDRMSSPGGTPWTGEAAVAARQSSYLNLVKVRGASDQLRGAADVARRGVEQLRACKEAVLEAVEDARADGFDVGDDDGRNTVRAVDLHTFKEAPNPEPDPPPGGWSSDPLMRAAQKIAYGHASGPDGHMADFPNMTKDQLADLIYGKMKMSIENPGGLQLGASKSDGAPLIYDPKDNVLIVRDKSGVGGDCGTVFKPDQTKFPDYIRNKFGATVRGFEPAQLADGPVPAVPAEPRPAPAPAEAPAPRSLVGPPVEPPDKPGPGVGKGGGGMPGLPFGGGIPWDSPATGPHPVHPHHPGQHHRMPLLGELPDDYEE
ncbi:hypothetical protein [Mycobacterium saskatchewanense]|uniref:hypothetical protein n=1 Tax=Mycobacterium saskatchewanense TaxID=220927 RepID=UPI0011531A87|nr:hypothetical protein [Mycobacterium saskatchewanense]